ncbi:Uncharacterized protein APZ42_019589 [Daphnia magna]|uniref:Uncharacterized protein n=1 Tax=Daphnia magna TaxID=35525 RepID=A0A164Y9L1_9CRUS|nr:Uncharacterized protein APZ42_019589 [Daphnia magna]
MVVNCFTVQFLVHLFFGPLLISYSKFQ